ncbi:MAG: hypothetical protein FWG96_00995 [Methanomassiliicoccaceae archaeon]|nr:hypothetical protein [Methanomassiliicoccaceae archaeon]
MKRSILDAGRIKDIRVLFLAKFADYKGDEKKATKKEDVIVIRYNGEIAKILSELFPNLCCSSDLSILLDEDLKSKYDYVFSLYNRMPFRNSEIFVSSLLEYYEMPYLGGKPNVRAVAEDKAYAKVLAHHLSIPTPKWRIYDKLSINFSMPDFNGPYFVKPRYGAASEHITTSSLCRDWPEAVEHIYGLIEKGVDVIVEEAVFGTLYSQAMLWNYGTPILLQAVRIESSNEAGIITYRQKKEVEGGIRREIADAPMSDLLSKYTKKIFGFIDPTDYIRVDYMVKSDGQPFFLEFNVCCNLGSHASIALSAAHVGISHENLVKNIVYSSLSRNNLINRFL